MDIHELNVGLIFGTDTGNTEEVGDKICTAFAEKGITIEMINVSETSPEEIEAFNFIIMGIPTWDFGGIQEDWENFEDEILSCRLKGKIIALYGLGDHLGYGDYFLDAMGWLNERVLKAGAEVVGAWSTEGYDFSASLAVNEDKSYFCGLAIDEDQEFHLTDERIESWVEQVMNELQTKAAA